MAIKIIEKATMPDGTKIQLEDWSDKNTAEYPDLRGMAIAAYPIKRNRGRYDWGDPSQPFRLHIEQNKYQNYSNDDVTSDFEALKSGKKTLEDLSDHFWYGDKDKWYLGMDVEYKGW